MNNNPVATRVFSALRAGWPALLALITIAILYKEHFVFYWKEWERSNGYYSHGMLVPAIALYMVWANRKRLAAQTVSPTWRGVLLIVPAIPLYLFGKWTGSGALMDASLMLLIIGSVWSTTGNRITRILLFPMLYLAFMMPLPGTILDEATMRIQLQSTKVAAVMLNITGYPSTLIGSNEIHSARLPEPLIVGVACSGFKLLISLMTFTAFFVYMIRAEAWKKAALVAFAVPLSIFINSLRIAMIGYAGIWTGTASAMHKFHDWSGYLGLVFCFVILFGVAKLLKASQFGFDGKEEVAQPAAPPVKRRGGQMIAPVLALVLLLVVGLTVSPIASKAKGSLDRSQIAASIGDWISTDVPISKEVVEELKTADLLQRVYTNIDDGRQIELFMEAARDTDAFHNPMMCIPGSGSGITDTQVIYLDFKEPKPMKVRASILRVSDTLGQQGYIIHWYMVGDKTFPTTSAIRRYMRLIQVQDMYDTLASFSHRAEVRQELESRQVYWYRFYTQAFDTEDRDIAAMKDFITELVRLNKTFGEM